MREIKFRAWYQPGSIMINPIALLAKPDTNLVYLSDHILMQYTGLKDKNGVEIYEGDVIEATWFKLDPDDISASWEIKAPVRFVGGGFKILPELSWYGGWLDLTMIDNISVIGNIYETPELLK